LGALDHVAVLPDLSEQLLGHGVVIDGRGAGVEVIGAPEIGELARDDRVVDVDQLAGRDPLLVGQSTRIGVPCSSEPLTMSTSCPAIRM
jgi:hypothetical protein